MLNIYIGRKCQQLGGHYPIIFKLTTLFLPLHDLTSSGRKKFTMAARSMTLVAMLAMLRVAPVAASSSGAKAKSCGFTDPDGGRPGGPGSDSHGTRGNGNGGFGLTIVSSNLGSNNQVTDTIELNWGGSGAIQFSGFLIQTAQAGTSLSPGTGGIKAGPCRESAGTSRPLIILPHIIAAGLNHRFYN
eukprot:TRINITY_DN11585_c0_g1_i5.p2 TRINITY_DN11585_c0_g1~~TRINITY_DN11585_c0_g1_i5.p2  ORF type:complete len:187 (+),score=20.22 TRINITY_DN11585_c0_g1_i5:1769-2329(+)